MAELNDKDLEQVDGAGFFDIVKKIGEGQMPGFDGQIRDVDLVENDGFYFDVDELGNPS